MARQPQTRPSLVRMVREMRERTRPGSSGSSGAGVGRWGFSDLNGDLLIAPDDVSGNALMFPFMSAGTGPMDYRKWSATTSPDWVDMQMGILYRTTSHLAIGVGATTDRSGTVGEYRIGVSPGGAEFNQLYGPKEIGFGIKYFLDGVRLPGGNHEGMWVMVQGRRTAGDGNLCVGGLGWVQYSAEGLSLGTS